jgi:hypothetical protein
MCPNCLEKCDDNGEGCDDKGHRLHSGVRYVRYVLGPWQMQGAHRAVRVLPGVEWHRLQPENRLFL